MRLIPLQPSLPHYDMQVPLDGVTYTLELRWNARAGSWSLSIATEVGDPIATGLVVVLNMPLGDRCTDARMPPGRLVALDTSGETRGPGETDFGTRVQLYYLEASEVPAIEDDDEDELQITILPSEGPDI